MARQAQAVPVRVWSGQIVDEVSAPNPHDEPVIQLLRCESGDHDGQEQVRFCFYSLRGAFQRHPLVVGEQDIADLREQLKHAPRLLALPQRLVAD